MLKREGSQGNDGKQHTHTHTLHHYNLKLDFISVSQSIYFALKQKRSQMHTQKNKVISFLHIPDQLWCISQGLRCLTSSFYRVKPCQIMSEPLAPLSLRLILFLFLGRFDNFDFVTPVLGDVSGALCKDRRDKPLLYQRQIKWTWQIIEGCIMANCILGDRKEGGNLWPPKGFMCLWVCLYILVRQRGEGMCRTLQSEVLKRTNKQLFDAVSLPA